MTKLLAFGASLKGIFIMASIAFVRGDMLPVILISVVFNLAQLGAKPFGQTLSKDTMNANTMPATRPGNTAGSVTFQNATSGLAPSVRAASSASGSMRLRLAMIVRTM